MTAAVHRPLASLALLLLGVAGFTARSAAQTPSSDWQFSALLYVYLPELRGSATFPTGTSVDISVDAHQIISNLNFAAMGAFEARRGPWGGFTDLVYMNATGSKSATRAWSIGDVVIPANVTADLDLHVRSTVWTLAGAYRAFGTPAATLDVLLGARGLFLQQQLGWQLSGDVGPLAGAARQGSGDSDSTHWDAIAGVKGRWSFGGQRAWFVPYYLDVGTGASQLTWQTLAGLGYAFSWGEVIGTWRYLAYHFSSQGSSLTMSGPAIGVAFRW
jgi:hypothetical protein